MLLHSASMEHFNVAIVREWVFRLVDDGSTRHYKPGSMNNIHYILNKVNVKREEKPGS